ncbi:phytanoyl-CoA dioxygenase family protein [Maribacter sp. X9]|uniref:phytanoyl-CoA dioxygenase family protein n=1 Tax=Maribacter sp. X9 TaxID=3402159 RepID=UPI003AF3908F
MNRYIPKNDHDAVLNNYQRDGVVRIREFFSPEMIVEIQSELERYMRDDLPSLPPDAKTVEKDGVTIRNLWRLELYNTYFKELAESDEIISLVAKLVNGKPILAGVETFNKPALVGSGVPYHQDNAYFCQTPPDMLTLWVAIDPVTAQNGPVYFIEESHKAGMRPTKISGVTGNSIGMAEQPNIPKTDQFCGLLNPGDATIHHCETVHHSDPNHSSNSRLGLLFVYRGEHTRIKKELKEKYTNAVNSIPPA